MAGAEGAVRPHLAAELDLPLRHAVGVGWIEAEHLIAGRRRRPDRLVDHAERAHRGQRVLGQIRGELAERQGEQKRRHHPQSYRLSVQCSGTLTWAPAVGWPSREVGFILNLRATFSAALPKP